MPPQKPDTNHDGVAIGLPPTILADNAWLLSGYRTAGPEPAGALPAVIGGASFDAVEEVSKLPLSLQPANEKTTAEPSRRDLYILSIPCCLTYRIH